MPEIDNPQAQRPAPRLCNLGSPQKSRLLWLAIWVLLGLFYVAPVYAYVDPGTGSIILQGLLAGVAVVITSISLFWQRIKIFFSSLFSSRKPPDPTPEPDSSSEE